MLLRALSLPAIVVVIGVAIISLGTGVFGQTGQGKFGSLVEDDF